MPYDNELTLIGQSGYTVDADGNQLPEETAYTVLCNVRSVMSKEFYDASVSGLKPEKVFIVHAYEYADQRSVEFCGKRYEVIRTYARGFEEMELVVQEKIGART